MSALVALFERLPAPVGAVVVVGGFVFISLAIARLVRRFAPGELLREHNDLTGFTFGVVGVIYAVLLGFIAVGVWQRYITAEEATYREASNLAAVYRDAAALPQGTAVRRDLRVYVDNVITRGWSSLQGGHINDDTEIEAERIARDVNGLDPHGARQVNLHAHMLDALSAALAARDERLAEDASGLNGVMWATVLLGGLITVAFTSLFGFKRASMQIAIVGTLALLIGIVIYLTMSLDYPFRGAIRVGPDAFERAITTFDTIDARR